jgi:hypothetical protein
LRRFISCSKVTSTRAPEAPIGWPIAMAPPLTLTLRGIPAEILVDRATLRGKGLVGFQIETNRPFHGSNPTSPASQSGL